MWTIWCASHAGSRQQIQTELHAADGARLLCNVQGNVDNFAYTFTPDPQVPLTARGHRQAENAGHKIRAALEVRLRSSVFEQALIWAPAFHLVS